MARTRIYIARNNNQGTENCNSHKCTQPRNEDSNGFIRIKMQAQMHLYGLTMKAASGLLLGCFWIASGLLLGCFWAASGLLLGCLWAPFELLLGCFWAALLLGCF